MTDVPLRPRSVLSLCAGYGGLERAIALAVPGIRLVGVVERQAYPAAVIASRMVEGTVDPCPIFDDLESFRGAPYCGRVDLVVAGFPCQGASAAGKRLGVEDERWLWPEVWRITQEVGASWLLGENVPGLLSVNRGEAFAQILGDLGASGWSAEWDCVPAGAVGAPHLRDRLFFLAAAPHIDIADGRRRRARSRAVRLATDADVERLETPHHECGGDRGPSEERSDARSIDRARDAADASRRELASDRRPDEHEERSDAPRGELAAADAASERCDEWLAIDAGAGREGGTDVAGGDQQARGSRQAADADVQRYEGGRDRGELETGERPACGGDADRCSGPWPGDSLERIRAIVELGGAHWDWRRAPEPVLRGMDDGPSIGVGVDDTYADQLHALGNGVVSYQAAIAFLILWSKLHDGAALDVLATNEGD